MVGFYSRAFSLLESSLSDFMTQYLKAFLSNKIIKMASNTGEFLEKLSSMIPPMPKLSAREEECELEMENLEGGHEAEEEEGLVKAFGRAGT